MPDSSPPTDPDRPAFEPSQGSAPKGLQNLPGLRLVVKVMTGYLLLAGLAAWFGHPYLSGDEPVDLEAAEGMASALLLAIGLMIPLVFVAFLAVRKSLGKQLALDLAGSPYERGDALPRTFVTICLIGAALTLGVGFFAVVIHLISGSTVALGIAGGATALLFAQLPTDDSLRTA